MTEQTKKITLEEMQKRGYVDVVGGNLPLKGIEQEINREIFIYKPREVIIQYDSESGRAIIYIPKEDFKKQ